MSEQGQAEAAAPQFNKDEHHGSDIRRALTPGGNPIDTSQPGFPVYHRKFANPAPLGLMAFATTTFKKKIVSNKRKILSTGLSLVNIHARHLTINNMVVGPAIGFGGLAQLLAGMWEFAAGNTFGATAFSTYGAFWISFAIILIPDSGVIAAYEADGVSPTALTDGLGFFLTAFFIQTFLLLLASLKSSIGLISVFFFLTMTFLLLAISEFNGNSSVQKAGGWFGLITAFLAWYVALAGLLSPDTSFFTLPTGEVKK